MMHATLIWENYLGEAYFVYMKEINLSPSIHRAAWSFCMSSSSYPDHRHYSRANK